jgi:N-acetylglucosamine-6-phosphate deacetylase
MDKLVKNMFKYCDLNIRQSVQMVTYNAARIQGLENEIGVLAEKKKADITVFDDNIDIKMTIINGKIRYNSF